MMATACRRQVRCAQDMCQAMTTWQICSVLPQAVQLQGASQCGNSLLSGQVHSSACAEFSEADQDLVQQRLLQLAQDASG